jgi:3-oxoacyl-[acyl-carrier protein] reductase
VARAIATVEDAAQLGRSDGDHVVDLGLTDRVYVVSGGTRGLGFAVAQALTAEGARVVVSGRDTMRLAAAVEELGERQAVGVDADNTDPASPGRLVAAALDRWGRLDGSLVNGGGPPLGTGTCQPLRDTILC